MRLSKYTVDNQLTLRRYYVDRFFECQAASLPQGVHVLDLGGHKMRKRGFFDIGGFGVQVTYANLTRGRCPDVQADAARLPLCACSIDVVICSELLEHVASPQMVLSEVHRILKPGGRVLMTAPFLYPIHADPWDFGRLTDRSWRKVVEESGFVLTGIEKQGLFFSVMVDFLRLYVGESRFLGRGTTPARKLLKRPLAWLAEWAVRQDAKHDEWGSDFVSGFTTGFGVAAVKP